MVVYNNGFETLRLAQRYCIKESKCSSINGYSGNYFQHSTYKLCHINSTYEEVKDSDIVDKDFQANIPSGLYKKPGE